MTRAFRPPLLEKRAPVKTVAPVPSANESRAVAVPGVRALERLAKAEKNEILAGALDYYPKNKYQLLLQGAMPGSADAAMCIEIANSGGQPIFLNSASFTPVRGRTVYKSITQLPPSPVC